MFGSLNNSSTTSASKKSNQYKSKKYFKDNKLSGLYQEFDPFTGKLKEQGRFESGTETGKWRVIDDDGDEIHYQYNQQRVGAICGDGTRSSATGRGACSWHGGVAQWIYEAVKSKVGGTGKYVPIEQRVEDLKKEVKAKFRITRQGLEFQQAIYNLLLDLADEKEDLLAQVGQLEESLLSEAQEKKQLQSQLSLLKQVHDQCLERQKSDLKKKEKAKDLDKQIDNEKSVKVYVENDGKSFKGASQEKSKQNTISKVEEKEKKVNNLVEPARSLKQDQKVKKSQNPPPLFEKYKASKQEILLSQSQQKEVQKKEEKAAHKKKVESDESDEWESDEDEKEQNQNALIRQLFQKMNLK